MEPKAGTRCECRDRRCHVRARGDRACKSHMDAISYVCTASAIRRVRKVFKGILTDGCGAGTVGEYVETPAYCAACAEYHEKGAKS